MRALGDPRVLPRRTVLRRALGAGLTAAAAALLPACGSRGDEPVSAGASREGPPETPTIRLGKSVIACYAAQALASGYLREEGFTDVQYLDVGLQESFPALAQGAIDMHMYPAPLAAWRVDAGDPIVMLSGVQVGCFYVYASDAVRSMSDLKGRTVATAGPGVPDHVVLGALLANVGIDIRKDVTVATGQPPETAALLARGEVDAIWTIPRSATGCGHSESGT